ncbi:MAG: acyltransferase, partial [Pedobacter sp.]
LTLMSHWHGDVATGWGYQTLWIAFTRMMFPFFAGLLLFRMGKLIRLPMAYIVCSFLLIIVFFLPVTKFNGLLDAACIIIVFPIIVAAGAGGKVNGWLAKLCKFSGDISYPIYIVHYPFIYIYTSWVAVKKPAPQEVLVVAICLFVFFMVLAYAALKLYDEPVRAWLKKKLAQGFSAMKE